MQKRYKISLGIRFGCKILRENIAFFFEVQWNVKPTFIFRLAKNFPSLEDSPFVFLTVFKVIIFLAPRVIHLPLSLPCTHRSDSGCEIFNVSLFREISSPTLLFSTYSNPPTPYLLFTLQVFLLLTRPL